MTTTQQRIDDLITNPHLLTFYAKTRCKDCYGRGVRTITSRVPHTKQWIEDTSICHCVRKAVEKEQRELEKVDG